MQQPSVDTIAEILRSMKEDQIPNLRAEMILRLDNLMSTLDRTVRDVAELTAYRDQHRIEHADMNGRIKAIQWVFGMLFAALTTAITFFDILKK